jgi:Prokaryotic membrane lipoprotein lipid attachment site
MKRYVLTIALALLLTGCNPPGDTKTAEEAVASFHDAFNNGRFDSIYTSADAHYRSIGTMAQSTEFLTGVRARLGRFQSGKTVGWNDEVKPGSHLVTLTRKGMFERGDGQETFAFSIADGKAILDGYTIKSTALDAN